MAAPLRIIGSHRQRSTSGSEQLRVASSERQPKTVGDTVPAGRVRINTKDNSVEGIELWVDGPCVPNPAVGGFTVLPREGEVGLVEFTGPEPAKWSIPVCADGWSDDVDVAPKWNRLIQMGSQQGTGWPPELTLVGSIPREVSSRGWYLHELIDKGTERYVDLAERTLRWRATIVLIAPTSASIVASPIAQAQAKAKANGNVSTRTITARNGDTLVSISVRELGSSSQWRVLQKLNGGLQNDNVKAGEKIKLPS